MMDPERRYELFNSLIGRPYQHGADGPEAFDCYGLVRHVLREAYDQDLPIIERSTVPATSNAIARAVATHFSRPVERQRWDEVKEPHDGDVALMGNVDGRNFHVGVAVLLGRVFSVLHADEKAGVIVDDVVSLPVKGFHRINYFRRRG
jgi:cell wall-associated NlpC family hydrolase